MFLFVSLRSEQGRKVQPFVKKTMSTSDDSSDSDASDFAMPTKAPKANVIAQAAASSKKKSYFSSSDDDDDDDLSSLDSDDSYFKAKKAPPPKKTAPKKPEPTKPPPAVVETKENVEEKKEEINEEKEEAEPVFEETTADWLETIRLARKRRRKSALKGARITWAEQDIIMCEFDPERSVNSIKDPEHVDEDYDEVPWDEQEYEELPWWEQPDIDEDDALTSLCKKVMEAGDTELDRQRAEAVETRVINFALKLKNKSLFRKKNPFKKAPAKESKKEEELVKAKEIQTGSDNKQEEEEKANPIVASVTETSTEDEVNGETNTDDEKDGEECGPSKFSGDLQTCLDALKSAKGGDSMTLQLPSDLSDLSRELMSSMVNKLQSDSPLKNVSVVIPSDVSEDFILSGGIESLLASISGLKDLEMLSIESSNEVSPPILPTSYISQALKTAAEQEGSRLTAVSVRKLRLSNSKDHMSELTEALCTLNMLPTLKSTKVSVEFLA